MAHAKKNTIAHFLTYQERHPHHDSADFGQFSQNKEGTASDVLSHLFKRSRSPFSHGIAVGTLQYAGSSTASADHKRMLLDDASEQMQLLMGMEARWPEYRGA